MNAILPIFTAIAAALAAVFGCGPSIARGAAPDAPTAASTARSAVSATSLPVAAPLSVIAPATRAEADAANLVRNAVAASESHASVSGKIRHEVDLFGHRMIGSGTYLQQGRGAERRLRMELKLQVDDQLSSLEQVCDGNYLWMHQDLLGKTTLSRIDLRRLRAALSDRPNFTTPASAMWTSLGGLPKLLKNLDESFVFTSVTPKQLDRLASWSIEGQWKPEKLAELLPEQKKQILAGQAADTSKLPEQVPRRVVLVLGQDDLFPYRIEYWGCKPRTKKSAAGRERLIVVMEFFEIQFDAAIDPRQFIYNPGDLIPDDQTGDYLQKLGFSDSRTQTTGARPPQRTRR